VDGQLGDGTTDDRSRPRTVVGLTHAVAVSAGSYHSCAVVEGGTAQCWGWNSFGQVGTQASVADTSASLIPELNQVSAIATGGYHTCALELAGSGSCWGQNDVGQLGNGGQQESSTPSAVFALPHSAAIAAGGRHTCTLVHDGFHDGTVQCWGANNTGELGDGSHEDRAFPTLVVGVTDVVALALGFTHSCALRSEGSVWCWGANDQGQLGDDAQSGDDSAVPVQVAGLTATAIAAGYNHTCAVLADGSAACWGANQNGQLGDGTTENRTKPVAVARLSDVRAIAGGSFHTCAESRGSISCWGLNDAGQLGDGTTASHSVPALAAAPE
jgi:alpha-tubulin suppressor-like RCC1 family protein